MRPFISQIKSKQKKEKREREEGECPPARTAKLPKGRSLSRSPKNLGVGNELFVTCFSGVAGGALPTRTRVFAIIGIDVERFKPKTIVVWGQASKATALIIFLLGALSNA